MANSTNISTPKPGVCIYVGIPRTASGSINAFLRKRELIPYEIWPPLVHRNATSKELKEVLGDKWDELFRFAFVREPIDRFISGYRVLHLDDVEMSVEQAIHYNEVVFRPQVEFLTEKVDFIGRYERFKTDWGKIAKKLGTKEAPEHLNASGKRKIRLSKKDLAFLREHYKEDFKRFKY